MKKIFFSIIIFYLSLFTMNYGYNMFFGQAGEKNITIYFLIFAVSSWLAIYPKIKNDKRLLTIKEKIIFVIFTIVTYEIFILYTVFGIAKSESQLPGLMIMGFHVFVSFCGVWLVISTWAEKLFEKQLIKI